MRKLTDEETFKLVDAARSGYAMDSMIEVDLNAKLSMGEDAHGRVNGCYVQAWVWVNFEDAGIEVEQGASTMTPLEQFEAMLAAEYRRLFETPEYALAKSRRTPEELAQKMTSGLAAGTANKEGEGIQNTCKLLGIPYTYRAIRGWLAGGPG